MLTSQAFHIALHNSAIALWIFQIISYFVFTPLNMQRLQMNYLDQGLFLFILGMFGFFFAQATGRLLIGRIRMETLSIIGLSLSSLALTLTPVAPNTTWLNLTAALWGLGNGIFGLTNSTIIGLLESRFNRLIFPLNFLGMSFGAITGSYLSGFAFNLGVSGLLYFSTLLGLSLSLCTLLFLTRDHEAPLDLPPMSASQQIPNLYQILCGLVGFIFSAGLGNIIDWSPLWLRAHFAVSDAAMGLIIALFTLGEVPSRLMASTLSQKLSRRVLIGCVPIVGSMLFYLCIWLDDFYFSLLGAFLLGMLWANAQPLLFSTAIEHSETPPHITLTSILAISYPGWILGPAIFSFTATRYGLTFNMKMTCLCFILASILYLCIKQPEPSTQTSH